MDDLLIKYILEETTPEESSQVQQWLAADAANRARFEKLHSVWQLASQSNGQLPTNTPHALQQLKQTLHARETVSIKRIWSRVWTAAAGVIGIAGVALGAYVIIKPKNSVKENPPVVQPDRVRKNPVRTDTVPALQPVPASPADTIPVVKPHKKKRPLPVAPVQRVHSKKKVAQQPTQPVGTIRVKKRPIEPVQPLNPRPPKKKRPEPVHPTPPVKKHKTPTAPKAPVKEPPIS